jgi:hypothetical protein
VKVRHSDVIARDKEASSALRGLILLIERHYLNYRRLRASDDFRNYS